MISLYPHQEQFIDAIRAQLRTHRTVLGQAPTGMGKAVCGAWMAKSAASKGFRVVYTCHRRELVEQASYTFTNLSVDHGVIASGFRPNRYFPTQIASVGSLQARMDALEPPQLIIIDEAKHTPAATWKKIIEWGRKTQAKVIGLDATPWRINGTGLNEFFEVMVRGPSVRWLIDNKFLSEFRIFAPPMPDMSGLHTLAGDYRKDEMEGMLDTGTILGDVVEHYVELAGGKRAIAFGVSIKHSKHIAEQFVSAGVAAAHIDADTPLDERRELILKFAFGEISVLSNVDLFGEGFDLSAIAKRDVPVEAVLMCRPTQSLALYLQQVGRALRMKSSPAIILDHAGNVMRHGMPDDDYEWTLEGREKKKGSRKALDPDDIKTRQCPDCYFIHRMPASSCPNCGSVIAPKDRTVEVEEGTLKEVDVEALRLARKQEQAGARSLEALIELGKKRGYDPAKAARWAAHVFTARQAPKRRGPDVPPPTDLDYEINAMAMQLRGLKF